jgi:hypothetical protein
MTLPSSGVMTLDMIRNEFGGGNPVYISNYYAGGPYVPAGAVGVNGPIPTGGLIYFSHFYGATKLLSSHTVGVASVGGNGWGYSKSIDRTQTWGSINPNTFPPIGNVLIVACYWYSAGNQLLFSIDGLQGNGGWTSININGTVLNRLSASFSQYTGPSPTFTQWVWSGTGNPFGTGGNVPVTFL